MCNVNVWWETCILVEVAPTLYSERLIASVCITIQVQPLVQVLTCTGNQYRCIFPIDVMTCTVVWLFHIMLTCFEHNNFYIALGNYASIIGEHRPMSVIANEGQDADQWAIGLQLASVLYQLTLHQQLLRTFSLLNNFEQATRTCHGGLYRIIMLQYNQRD